MNIFIRKSAVNKIMQSGKNQKLEALKSEVIAILKKSEEKEVKKATDFFAIDESKYSYLEKSTNGWIEKAGYGVGTIRVWKGKKYKKVSSAPVKWVRVYNKEDRGAKSSMTRLINKVKSCNSEEELYQLCMQNHAIFQDENGVDLPIMDKLRQAIDEKKNSASGNKPKTIGEGSGKTYQEFKDDIESVYPTNKKEETEEEKHQNRSDAMKGNQNARKYGNIEVDDENIKSVTRVMAMSNEDIDKAIENFEKEINERPNGYLASDYKNRIKIYKNEKEQRKIGANNLKDDEHIPGVYKKSEGLNTISKLAAALNISKDEARKRITSRWSNSEWGNDPMKRYLDINDYNGKGWAGIPDFSQPIYDNAVKEVVEDYLINKLNIKDADNDTYIIISEEAYDAVNHDTTLKQAEENIKKRLHKIDSTSGNNSFENTQIGKIVEKYATDKQIKNLINKADIEDFASDDTLRSFMNGTYQEDGYKIATEGHILAMLKADYPDSEEGRIKASKKYLKYMDKKISNLQKTLNEAENDLKNEAVKGVGTNRYKALENRVDDIKKEIESVEEVKKTGYLNSNVKFPSYKKVIPSMGNTELEKYEGFEKINDILKVAKVAATYKKGSKNNTTSIKVGNETFAPDLLIKALSLAEKNGLKEVLFDSNRKHGPIEFKGDNGSIVIMPLVSEGAVVFDSQNGEVSYPDKDKNSVNTFLGEETKVESEEDKLKAEKKADKEKRTADTETKQKLAEDVPEGVTPANYQKYIDVGSKLYTRWGYDMNDPRQQASLKKQIKGIVDQINNKDFGIVDSLANKDNEFTRMIWTMQTGGISAGNDAAETMKKVESYFGPEATAKFKADQEEKRKVAEIKRKEDEARVLSNRVDYAFNKTDYFSKKNYVSDESKEVFKKYLADLPSNRQESAINRMSKDLIRYQKDGKEKIGYTLDYIKDLIDDGTPIENIERTYRDIKSKPIVAFAKWYASGKAAVEKSIIDESDFLKSIENDYSDENEISNAVDEVLAELFN